MGVCVVRLIDFNLDGTLELLLAWPESEEAYHSYHYAIWTSPDGIVAEQVCENSILDGVQSYCPFIKLVSRTDGMFLREDVSTPEISESHVYCSVSPSGLNDVLTLGYDPYGGDDGLYMVNGESVNSDTYIQAESDFLEGAEVEQISFALADFEDAAPLVETIRSTQETLALLGIEPSPDGLDIAPSTPEQAGYPPIWNWSTNISTTMASRRFFPPAGMTAGMIPPPWAGCVLSGCRIWTATGRRS